MMNETKTDKICLTDRYQHSQTFGERVLDFAILWKRPGAPMKAENMTGALGEGHIVEILEKKQYKQRTWAKVKAIVNEAVQTGWLVLTLLEEAGAKEPGIAV